MLMRLAFLALVLVAASASAQVRPKPYTPKGTPPPAAAPRPAVTQYINGVPDTGQFLPNDVLLGRVNDRNITVGQFVNAYFNSYPEDRPSSDSTGRVEFLRSMINKEVLGFTARGLSYQMGFEERLTMRTHTQRVLSNMVYMRYVSDSVRVSDADVQRSYEYMKTERHVRHILFGNRTDAARVRSELLAKRITWDAAFTRYHLGPRDERRGDLGWTTLVNLPPEIALPVFALRTGEISEPLQDLQGFHLIQSIESRPSTKGVPDFNAVRTMLRLQITNVQTNRYADAIQGVLRQRAQLTYDTTAMTRLAAKFPGSNVSLDNDASGAPTMSVEADHPEFSPADTATIIARWKNGVLSMGGLLKVWTDITPLARPVMNTFGGMQSQVDAVVLEPYMAEYAVELGLDKDPEAIRQIEQKREEILVKRIFADSIESKVWISRADRQKYYREHPALYTTYPAVRFAALHATRRAEADSLAALLRGGKDAAELIRADSVAGIARGSIQERNQSTHGAFHKLLFEELRPGQVSVEGPDRAGDYVVLQLLAFDPGRLLPFEEVEGLIDESMQNMKQEEALNAMLARLRKRCTIEEHPELVMRVRLVDPTLDH